MEERILYDLAPLHAEEPKPREYDLEALIGGFYSYLLFQERFKIDDQTWKNMFEQKWFPFAHLDNTLLKEMINHAKEGWNIDHLLPRIADNVIHLLHECNPINNSIPYYAEHAELFNRAIEGYLKGDHISCASILYPRIEGLLRSFYRLEGYTSRPSPDELTKTVIEHHREKRISLSLLLPEKFHYYLDNIYFAHFVPGTSPGLGRHSVAHGEAKSDDFNLKSTTIGLLIIYQLSLFILGS